MRNDVPQAVVIQKISDIAHRVRLFVLEAELNSQPGQFVMLWIPEIDEKPFSIAGDMNGKISFAISDVGPFSHALFQKKEGDMIGMRGPFGHGYSLPQKQNVVLVGGGYGMAPLHNTGIHHQKNGCMVTAVTGARSAKNVLFEQECKDSGFQTFVTTDDGSVGEKGFVTMALQRILQEEKIDLVQTCGPEKMMKVVAETCQEKNISCEVSVERYMKCGFGVCGQCVVDGSGERMCMEGPVVSGERVIKEFTDFGEYHRGAEGQKILW